MSSKGGWAGKILRVNLTTGAITAEDTMRYKDYIGGMGIGYKVLWDEVPAGTKAYDVENKIVFGAGPLTGTGAMCSGRLNITSLCPVNAYDLITDSHAGGHFTPELKYAGWDAIIVEGKASSPVWLRIENSEVTLEDASEYWGTGIFNTTAEIVKQMGNQAQVAAIGQAGENMVNQSVIITGSSHSAGGHGGVMGSKNLKAIGVLGTLPVEIAADRAAWNEVDKEMLAIIGSNNQHVVPSTPQPWAEFHSSGSRWTGRPGLYWGAANPPVETGECHPSDVNSIGLRCQKAVRDLGDVAEEYTQRMGGCHSCPIRCHGQLHIPELEEYGLSPYAANTCAGWSFPRAIMLKGFDGGQQRGTKAALFGTAFSRQLADDYGLWCNYNQLTRDFKYAYETGVLERVLPEDEYNSIPWDKLEAGDVTFLFEFYRRISLKEGEFSHLGDGSAHVAKRWGFGDDYWNDRSWGVWSPLGFPRHHSNETAAQVGAVLTCMFNRDPQLHSHVNFWNCGLPYELMKEIAEENWGPGALDAPRNYTPVNQSKVNFTKFSIIRNVLHDSLTLCNWMWPMTVSPLKERGYRGDTSLEAQYFTMATGIETSEEELDLAGERIFTLHRAMTVKQMGTMDMRNEHDFIPEWAFETDPDQEPFTPGTDKMDRDDMQLALTMFYKEMGWDEVTGAPTKATLERLGMPEVAAELEERGLLPS